MARFVGTICVEQNGYWWILLKAFEYLDDSPLYDVLVPTGFITDFASTPRLVWNIFPPTDPEYSGAALIHDRLYETHALERRECDATLFRAMAVNGTPCWKRYLMWLAVRWFGNSSYVSGPYRQHERLRANAEILTNQGKVSPPSS